MLKDLSNPGETAVIPLQLKYLGLHCPLGPGYQNLHHLTEERLVHLVPSSVESSSRIVPWSCIIEQQVLDLLHGHGTNVHQWVRHLQGSEFSEILDNCKCETF